MRVRQRFLSRTANWAVLVCMAGVLCPAQQRDNRNPNLDCADRRNDRNTRHCEMREVTIAATGTPIVVEEVRNGGVSVKGWAREDIWVRAQITTKADTGSEARDLARQVRIETAGLRIVAAGPERDNDRHWSVAYEVFVPHRSDLSLAARNGGIHVADVHGNIEFETRNGGVSLRRLAGDVSGQTRNGGVSIDLAGDHWEGERMDVQTRNGGVKLEIPGDYSARVETETVNGGVKVDFPVTVQGTLGKKLSFDLGSGGALVRAVTTNGGIVIRRKG